MEVAVEHDGAGATGHVEGLAAVEHELTLPIEGATFEGIVGAFEVAAGEDGAFAAVEWTGVQSRYEAAVLRRQKVAVGKGQLCLRDGVGAARPVLCGVARIDKVYVSVVAQREVLQVQSVAMKAQHGEVAHGALRLSAVHC